MLKKKKDLSNDNSMLIIKTDNAVLVKLFIMIVLRKGLS